LASLDYESKLVTFWSLINYMTILRTTRLVLRPFREDDIDSLAQLMANPDFMRFSPGPYTREQTQTVLDKLLSWNRAGLPSQFAVTLRPTELKTGCNSESPPNGRTRPVASFREQAATLLGYCGFFHQVVDETNEIEIGYRLHPDYWNQGLATEAAIAVREHGFADLELSRVISLIHPDNAASRRVAEKIGMLPERQTRFKGFPAQIFALNRPRWLTNLAG
jgi:[ribosomal protein S5]-alanine N-acetyltransferase